MTDRVTDTVTDKPFRMNNQKFMLTYKTHITKVDMIKFITMRVKETKFIRCAHETGKDDPETPYPHTHVLVDVGKAFQTRNCRHFDLVVNGGEVIHPHIQMIKDRRHWENSVAYLAKEDPENKDLKVVSLVTRIQNCDTVEEARSLFVKRPSDIMGVNMIFKYKEDEIAKTIDLQHKWQKELYEIVMNKPDRRKIYWYWEPKGNTGKSHFCDYMADYHPKDVFVLEAVGKFNDVANILKNARDAGWTGKICLIDLPRQCQDKESLYRPLENIKNGRVTSGKYDGCVLRWNPGHVVVFANWEPEWTALSTDRWRPHRIVIESNDWPSGGAEAPPRGGG